MTNPTQAPLRRSVGYCHALACAITAACLVLAAVDCPAQEISPRLVANNLWLANRSSPSTTPSTGVMSLAGEAGVRLIRIGGNEFDQNMPSDQALLTWVNRIRAIGAEPLIQVSQFRSAAQAAATVQFINVTSGADVSYWSIGNEPWLHAKKTQSPDPTEAQIAATIEGYFKPISAAMKAVDPSIRIFGVDSEDFQSGLHARLFGGSNNIAGKIPGQDYYYCDGLSWHRYPQDDGIDPAFEGLADIRSRIEGCRARVDAVNAAEGRTGSDALIWCIGEFNSKNGPVVHTWGNGQMFAGVYGLAMKHGADYAAAWSLYESDGLRTATDFGMLDGSGLVPRPSYWHSRFVSRHFSGRYLEGNPSISSSSSDIMVYGAEDATSGQVSVMILNRGGVASIPYTLHLNRDGTFAAAGAVALNVDASRSSIYNDVIPPRSTHVLVFRRDSFTKIVYTNDDFIAGQPPQTTVTAGSPLRGVLDSFDSYTDIGQQGYWQTLHSGSGQASLASGRLVLRASDTDHAAAAVGSPLSPTYNFFNRGFAITIEGFSLTAADLPADETQFRLCLNSSSNRSFPADDSLVLRLDPHHLRLGYKVNQSGVQGELRAGADVALSSLIELEFAAVPQTIRLSLEPIATDSGDSTIFYQIQLDGGFGRITRSGTFTASAAEWGAAGDSALVLESRRDATSDGGAGSYAEAAIDTVLHQPLLVDDFNSYTAYSQQDYWQSLLVGSSSTAVLANGSAVLSAQSLPFASASIAGTPVAELNFFQRGFTLDFKNIAITNNNLPANEAFFRISLCSTAQRPFTTPDALTLRITPERMRFGFKLDQPSVDAELRTGTANSTSSLIDEALPGPVTEVRLTLVPMAPAGPATPILYAMRLSSALGDTIRTGTFTADLPRWGSAGDSSLVLEARRASPATGDSSSYMRASVGSVAFSPIADDFATDSPSFPAWRLSQFTLEELASAMISGADATPAGDGIGNLLKYAFGLDAKVPAAPGFMPGLVSGEGNSIGFAHEQRAGAGDLSYTVEASTDLMLWDVPVVETSRSSIQDGWVTVSSSASLTGDSSRVFYRVRVASPLTP